LKFEASLGKCFVGPYLEKPFTKTVLVEWFKVKALSSSPSTEKNLISISEELYIMKTTLFREILSPKII
jgi:hypothetical protein